jgi:hypothetical protein
VAAVGALAAWCAFLDGVLAPPAPSADAPPPAADRPAAPAPADLLLEVVRSLVEEGSVEERPLLDRAEQLSVIVDPSEASTASHWDGVAASVGDLLAADLRDVAHPARRRLALVLLRDAVSAAADHLAAQAATEPASADQLRIGGRPVRVTVEGADPAELAAATASTPPPRRLGPVQLGVGAAVVLGFIVLAIAAAPGWVVLAVLAAAGLGGWWLVERNQLARAVADDERVAERARQQVAERAQSLASAVGQARDAAAQATVLRERLRGQLAELTH